MRGQILGLTIMAGLCAVSVAEAHILPWPAGEQRVKGVGSCAKGPCTKRVDWSATQPHHHHANCVVIGRSVHSPNEKCGR